MEDRTLNFILVLVTGRVWGNGGGMQKINVWDCKEWMDFITLNFIPCLFPTRRIKLHKRFN